jgi:hypothetical protein
MLKYGLLHHSSLLHLWLCLMLHFIMRHNTEKMMLEKIFALIFPIIKINFLFLLLFSFLQISFSYIDESTSQWPKNVVTNIIF